MDIYHLNALVREVTLDDWIDDRNRCLRVSNKEFSNYYCKSTSLVFNERIIELVREIIHHFNSKTLKKLKRAVFYLAIDKLQQIWLLDTQEAYLYEDPELANHPKEEDMKEIIDIEKNQLKQTIEKDKALLKRLDKIERLDGNFLKESLMREIENCEFAIELPNGKYAKKQFLSTTQLPHSKLNNPERAHELPVAGSAALPILNKTDNEKLLRPLKCQGFYCKAVPKILANGADEKDESNNIYVVFLDN